MILNRDLKRKLNDNNNDYPEGEPIKLGNTH